MNRAALAAVAVVFTLLVASACTPSQARDEMSEVARLRLENEALRLRLEDAAESEPETLLAGVTSPEGRAELVRAEDDDWSWADEPLPEPRASADPKPLRRASEPEPTPAREPVPAPAPVPVPVPDPDPVPVPDPVPAPERRPAPDPDPVLAPDPEPSVEIVREPAPIPVTRRADAGARLELLLLDELHSGRAFVGDLVEGILDGHLRDADGDVVLPSGTRLLGRVTEVRSARKVKKKSAIAVSMDRAVTTDGREISLTASARFEGEGYTKRDGKRIAGAAAAGALLGQLLGKDSESTAKGAAIGGAIGTGVVMSKRGSDVVIPADTLVELVLERDVEVTGA